MNAIRNATNLGLYLAALAVAAGIPALAGAFGPLGLACALLAIPPSGWVAGRLCDLADRIAD